MKKRSKYRFSRLEGYFRDPVIGDGVMRRPMSGSACANIRLALGFLQYPIDKSEEYDRDLERTVLEFQRDQNHTSIDGYVGPGTRRLLTEKLLEKAGERYFNLMNYPKGKAFPQVFLSYAREDTDAAERLYNDLNDEGVNVWFDKESLRPGQNWSQAIGKAIGESRYFLALLSENSLTKKGFVQKEMEEAFEVLEQHSPTDVFVVPIRLENCNPSDPKLGALHQVDLFPNWRKGLTQLLKTLVDPNE